MARHRAGRPASIRGEASRRGVSEYQVRVERAARQDFTRSQAAGHPRAGETPLSKARTWEGIVTVEGIATLEGISHRQASILGRYEHDTKQLLEGRMSKVTFQTRWTGRRVAGVELESDPSKIEAVAAAPKGARPKVRYEIRRGHR